MTTATPEDWLHQLGGTWPTLALGYRYEVQLGKMLDEKRISGKNLFPYLRNVDVQWGRINTKDLPEMDFALSDQMKYSLRPGDLLVCEGGEVGRAALWPGTIERTVYFQKALHRLRPYDASEESPRFMFYALQTAAEMNAYGAGGKATIAHLPAEAFRRIRFPKPPLVSQELVADFLDEQTTRIDALIAEKSRLAIAVREYEQAQISQLLAQGISNAPQTKTGNIYVPAAPSHWRVVPFKRALQGMEQGWSPQCDSRPAIGSEWGVLKVGCVNSTKFNPLENKALPPELTPDLSCVIRQGDVLVSRANTRELVGSAALVWGNFPTLLLCDKLYRLKLASDWVTSEFAVLLLRSDTARRQIELGASGASSSMQNISQDVIRELVVALPPLEEQLDIIEKAKVIRAKTDDLASHVDEHIARLREYRVSLISAAVTGQFDINSYKEAA